MDVQGKKFLVKLQSPDHSLVGIHQMGERIFNAVGEKFL